MMVLRPIPGGGAIGIDIPWFGMAAVFPPPAVLAGFGCPDQSGGPGDHQCKGDQRAAQRMSLVDQSGYATIKHH